jgi:class 3 adenylate cyclase
VLTFVIAAAAFVAGVAAGWFLRKPKPPIASLPPVDPAPIAAPAKPREVIVLVCDLRPLGADAFSAVMIRFVADLQRVLGGIVTDEGGRVETFAAERMTAVFDGSKANAAIEAAERMTNNVSALNRRMEERDAVGIGIHRGPMIEGEAKSGDTVDIAARLQALTAERQAPFLLTEDVLRKLRGDRERYVGSGELQVDGSVVRLYAPKSDEAAVQLDLIDMAAMA